MGIITSLMGNQMRTTVVQGAELVKAGVIEHGNITRNGILRHGEWCQQGIKQGMENLGIYLALGIGLGLGGFIFASTCLYVWKTTETNYRRTGSPIKHNEELERYDGT